MIVINCDLQKLVLKCDELTRRETDLLYTDNEDEHIEQLIVSGQIRLIEQKALLIMCSLVVNASRNNDRGINVEYDDETHDAMIYWFNRMYEIPPPDGIDICVDVDGVTTRGDGPMADIVHRMFH